MVDVTALIQPISESTPAGVDPRSDVSPTSRYFTLKDVRNQARAAERNALVDDEPMQAFASEWLPIAEQVPEVISSEGKDLELVAWWIEALCRLEGFAGLARGFRLARLLIEHHWEDLFPLPDEDGPGTRIAALIGLNGIEGEGALIMPISFIPLVDGPDGDSYATWQVEQAIEITRLEEEKKRQKLDAGYASLEEIEQAVKSSAPSLLVSLADSIEEAKSEFESLSQTLDAAMNGEPQPTSQISKALQRCQDALNFLAGDIIEETRRKRQESINAGDADMAAGSEGGADGNAAAMPEPSIDQLDQFLRTREQAIGMLKDVAEFFRKTEPHSPMSYAIDQVVRWSGMELPDLLQELIADGDARNGFFRLAGIRENN